MRLAEIMRKWRIVSEISLRELAKETGINHSTMNRFERGLPLDSQNLVKILTFVLSEQRNGAKKK